MKLSINIIGRHISLSSNKLKWPLDTPAPYSWLKERNSALEKESLFLFPCFVRFGNRASSPSREHFDEPRARSFPPVRFCSNFSNTWLFAEAAPNWEFFLQQRKKALEMAKDCFRIYTLHCWSCKKLLQCFQAKHDWVILNASLSLSDDSYRGWFEFYVGKRG